MSNMTNASDRLGLTEEAWNRAQRDAEILRLEQELADEQAKRGNATLGSEAESAEGRAIAAAHNRNNRTAGAGN
jgi:hypothetical protein